MKHNANVPAFLTKLWTLVEDGDTNEFICWSQVTLRLCYDSVSMQANAKRMTS